MPMVPLVVAGAAMAGEAVENGKASNAAQGIATQQQNMANQANAFAQPTSQELQQMSQQNSMASQAVTFQQNQLANVTAQMSATNPVIQAAFNQQAQILNGQVPNYLSPLQKQLQIQAQQSNSQIGAAMGRGGATSSAGIAAGAQFSQQNAMTMMQAQQQAMGVLGQTGANAVNSQNAISGGYNAMGQAASALNQGAFNMSNQVQMNQMNAALGTAKFQGVNQTASLYNAQSTASMLGGLAGMGAGAGMAKAFGPSSSGMGSAGSAASSGGGAGFDASSYASSGMAGGGAAASSPWSLFGGGAGASAMPVAAAG